LLEIKQTFFSSIIYNVCNKNFYFSIKFFELEQFSNMNILSITLVLYHNDLSTITKTIKSCLQDVSSEHIYVVDNSKDLKLKKIKSLFGVNYLKNKNKGFGSGHNKAFKEFKIIKNYKYNLVINPDIIFKKNVLKKLVRYLENNPQVGALMPQIMNFDGSIQFARRCLPTPEYLIFKRLFPNSRLSKDYELRDFEPSKPIELIGICGCFMIIRLDIIKKIKLFDERFFMYFEDFDLARRISLRSKVIYYPLERVYHEGQRAHRANLKLLYHLILSAVKYFLKWGIKDKYTNQTNMKLLHMMQKNSL